MSEVTLIYITCVSRDPMHAYDYSHHNYTTAKVFGMGN